MLDGNIMNETEYKEILDRQQNIKDITDHFQPQLDLLKDLTNYGTNLIIRSFSSSDRSMPEIVVVGVLLKQVVSMLDAAEILISNTAIHAAHLEARVLFEASLFIDWILKEDSSNKANHYYVSCLRNERLWAQRSIRDTPENQAFSESTKQLDYDILERQPHLEEEAKKHLEEVNKILSSEEFKAIDEKFEELKNKNRSKHEPAWYKPFQVHSIRHMAKLLNRLTEYDIFYAKSSRVIHSTAYQDHIRFSNQVMHFKAIRSLEDFNSLFNFIVSVVFHTYKSILSKYRPSELVNFNRKYVEHWREPFINIKQVNYNYDEAETKII